MDDPTQPDWWRTAVVYQVYIRSFRDENGDGLGDVAGLRRQLPYLADLGVDAIWINPWYPSPQADAGYDVADYRDIAPEYGTLEEAEKLLHEIHQRGMKVFLDIVPNHTSSEHAWFKDALAGDEAARARYVFRPGRGDDGTEPPNDWTSNFGGPAWTQVPGEPGLWYLHLFAPEQPDLDWTNAEVVAEFEDVLRFWFDREVDGFRIDVAHGLAKADGLPDAGTRMAIMHNDPHPAWDQDAVHEVYRGWRRLADSYDPPRVFVGETWVPTNERLAMYVRPDELHTTFQFDFLRAPFGADVMRETAVDALGALGGPDGSGAPSTWVLSNHDVVRHVTRYARSQPDHPVETDWERTRWPEEEPDLELGRRRARAALLVVLALPGTAYLYQGEELGLEEVEEIPGHLRQDPIFTQSDNGDPGRDGCRVPLPWSGDAAPFGFSPEGSADPWLPQPASWSELTADKQVGDPGSMWTFYRDTLALRRRAWVPAGPLTWQEAGPGLLAFRRGDLECWLNTSGATVPLRGEVLLASSPVGDDGGLPHDAAAWVRVGQEPTSPDPSDGASVPSSNTQTTEE